LPSASQISKSPSTRMDPLGLIVILAGILLDASRVPRWHNKCGCKSGEQRLCC
jgi:hypothetical protein